MTSDVTAQEALAHLRLVDRVTASRAFSRAPRLRELLLDIVAHAHQPELLTEQQIGTRIFGRDPAYNPADDNIVRASARQLRIKLKEYFDGEGLHEPLLLEIPKGGYHPVFTPRAALPAVPSRPRPAPWAWMGLAAVLVAAIAALLVERAHRAALMAEPDTLFSCFFNQTAGPVRFVLTDSALGIMSLLLEHPPAPEEYSTRSFVAGGQRLLASKPDALRIWNFLESRQITSLADVGVLTRLLQTHPSAARRTEIRHARHMRTRDFKTGNFIITGSHRANPWAALFDQPLNFSVVQNHIVNRQPRPGESAEYRNQGADRQWALISMTRNLSDGGWVLLAEGLGFEGTEGAGEFLLSPQAAERVRKLLGVSAGSPLPPFELLLETTALEGTARSSKIVAWRRY